MEQHIIHTFQALKVVGDRSKVDQHTKQCKDSALIDFLQETIKAQRVTAFEDIGFCYWNISDNYAFLRNGQGLYNNHSAFFDFIATGESKYLYWLVNDATQRFTLETNGCSSFWWELYRYAIQQNRETCCPAAFSAHRTALSIHPVIPHHPDNLHFTLSAAESFLNQHKTHKDFLFYSAMLHILISRHTGDAKDIVNLSTPFLSKLSLQDQTNPFLPGEWGRFACATPERQQACLVMNAAINCLIYAGQTESAKELYESALSHGLSKNRYIETRLYA